MEQRGYRDPQPNARQPYTGVPAEHGVDVCTFVHYVGAVPDLPTGKGWNDQATRGWFALSLGTALNDSFGETPR